MPVKDEIRCPDKARCPGDLVGCGSTHVVGPDDEGFYDCLDCGLFFKADAAGESLTKKYASPEYAAEFKANTQEEGSCT